MHTIAIVNEKGGTGKTTTAVNLSAAVGELGQRVLLVDLDGQAASSRWLGVEEDTSFADALYVGKGLSPLPNILTNVSLAPASGKLDAVAHDLRPTQGGQLRKLLGEVSNQFDYIIIDCPPSLGNRLIGNALLAASHAVVPVETSILALDGLKILLTTLDDVREGFGHNIILAGVLACRFDARTRLSRLVLAELKRALPGQVFETVIRENVRMRECPASGQSILTYAPDSHAAEDYRALAKELLAANLAPPVETPALVVGAENAGETLRQNVRRSAREAFGEEQDWRDKLERAKKVLADVEAGKAAPEAIAAVESNVESPAEPTIETPAETLAAPIAEATTAPIAETTAATTPPAADPFAPAAEAVAPISEPVVQSIADIPLSPFGNVPAVENPFDSLAPAELPPAPTMLNAAVPDAEQDSVEPVSPASELNLSPISPALSETSTDATAEPAAFAPEALPAAASPATEQPGGLDFLTQMAQSDHQEQDRAAADALATAASADEPALPEWLTQVDTPAQTAAVVQDSPTAIDDPLADAGPILDVPAVAAHAAEPSATEPATLIGAAPSETSPADPLGTSDFAWDAQPPSDAAATEANPDCPNLRKMLQKMEWKETDKQTEATAANAENGGLLKRLFGRRGQK